MHADRFGALSRVLTAAGSRRGAITAVLGSALGLLGLAHPEDAAATKSGKCKRKCGECEKCQKGDCTRKNGKKRCKPGKCRPKPNGIGCTAPSGGQCQAGSCACSGGLTSCGGRCVDTQADETNCGTCGTGCTTTQACQAGSCFPRSTCAATVTNYCAPLAPPCGTGMTACFCARSAEGNVVCLHDEDEMCTTAPLCQSSADCPPGEACIDAGGCCAGDPPGSKRCLARCPAPAS